MRPALAIALIVTAVTSAASMPAAARGRGPWCVIENDGKASWICYPTHRLCHHFGEAPGTGHYCVQNPAWSGRG
jgi:hypothetical protein